MAALKDINLPHEESELMKTTFELQLLIPTLILFLSFW